MKRIVPVLFLGLIVVVIPLAIVVFPLIYTVAIIVGVALVGSVSLRIIKPIWIIVIIFICAPFIDVLRATYFKSVPFMGVYQELILLLMLVSKINIFKDGIKFRSFGLIDYLIILYIIWNLFQVIQSPSILGGLYVWRWYSIGPLTYLAFRLFSFTKHECAMIISSICIGLVAASIYIFYQYFILGPENAAQISQSLGFTAFYRIGWRLPGPFGSPLVASASYSILILFGMALLSINRFNWVGFCLIIIGILAIFITLSRSGVAIGLVGLFAVLIMNFKKIKYKILPAFLGILLMLQFSYLIPETRQFLSYITNTNLDSYDTDRINQFKHILVDAITKYPFGIGFSGGGAVSLEAFKIFGGDSTYMPEYKYLGGDSVLLATLQTSGFMGFFLLIAIFVVFIRSSVLLLACNLADSQRVICLASLGFFLGTFVMFGNLIDVWPLKLYLWFFGAIVINFQAGLSRVYVKP